MTQARFPARTYPDEMTRTIWTAGDGWPLRVHDWPNEKGRSRGAILFQTGRGDLLEKYIETCAHWHERGWHVTAMDWRGQGGSGRLAKDPHVGHIDDFATWTKDLSDFWDDWRMRVSGPHILMGHSMGGHLALRTVMERGIAPDALILSAPMLGFELGKLPVGPVFWLAEHLSRWWPEHRAWPANEKPSLSNRNRQNLLTHDEIRYEDEQDWLRQHPELRLGPPSLKWLVEAYRSTQWTEEQGRLEALSVPTQIIGTDGDRLVSPAAIRRFAARIPGVHLEMYGQEVAHEILREVDQVRDNALACIDHFLGEVVPAR